MGTQFPSIKREEPPTQFSAHVYYGQTAGWIKMPLIGTEEDVGPGDVLLDGVQDPQTGTAPPNFWPMSIAHVYCGHGRPSQLLLSSCL